MNRPKKCMLRKKKHKLALLRRPSANHRAISDQHKNITRGSDVAKEHKHRLIWRLQGAPDAFGPAEGTD